MAQLLPPPFITAADANGSPISGAKLYFYATGTTTPATVYTDSGLSTPHASPVVADSAGRFAPIYLNPTTTYRAKMSDASDVLVKDIDPLTTNDLDGVLFEQAGENSVGRTAQEKLQEFLSPEDKGDTDDAWAHALADEPGRSIWAQSITPYTFTTTKLPTSDVRVNGPCEIKPSGNIYGFWTGFPTATDSQTVVSGATEGSFQVIVADASAFLPGRWVRFSCDDTNAGPTSYPYSWAKVIAVDTGTDTVTLSHGLLCTYAGTITAEVYASMFAYDFAMRDVLFDGSLNTKTTDGGLALHLCAYRKVVLDNVEVQNFSQIANINATGILVFGAREARIKASFHDNTIRASHLDVQECVDVLAPEVIVDGSGFGVNFTRCDRITGGSIVLNGRIDQEQVATLTASLGNSTRGVKITGVGRLTGMTIKASGYDTPVRMVGGKHIQFDSITLDNCGKTKDSFGCYISSDFGSTSQLAESMSIGTFNATNLTGSALGVLSDKGRLNVHGGFIKNVTDFALYAANSNGYLDDIVLDGLVIENWDTSNNTTNNPRAVAISSIYGGTFTNLTFRHTNATKPCFEANGLVSGRMFHIAGIRRPNGNPLFSGGLDVESSGIATIPSGSTQVTVTHNLVKTPSVSEIRLTPAEDPTNGVGAIWVSNITSTTFRINCESDPGASNLDIGWRAALAMPFTV